MRFDLKESRKGFCQEESRSFHAEGPKTKKSAGTNSGKSRTRYLEVESTRSRVESMRECVKLKTVTVQRYDRAINLSSGQTVQIMSIAVTLTLKTAIQYFHWTLAYGNLP